MENISFCDSFVYTESRVFNNLCGANIWQTASYGAGCLRQKSVKPDDEWCSLQEKTLCKSQLQMCSPSTASDSKDK